MPVPSVAAETVRRLGLATGFDLVRVASAEPLATERARYLHWLDAGRQGEMNWMTAERAVRSADPAAVLPGVRSVVSVGLSYWSGPRPQIDFHGHIARYAWGDDYHSVLGERLESLIAALRDEFGGDYRWHVDTGPAMDKALAVRAGLGWYGKNTNVLTRRFGSFVLLGEICTTLELQPDAPSDGTCGSCRLCLAACPTGALGPDYTIDSRKCISYLTIEHRGPIPRELRPRMGAWVFGCDICQDVCPPSMDTVLQAGERSAWARTVRTALRSPDAQVRAGVHSLGVKRTPSANPFAANGSRASVDLVWLLGLSQVDYVASFRGSAIKRAKAWMLRRNAAVALGNVGTGQHVEPLMEAMGCDEHRIVRGHAAWALGEIGARLRLLNLLPALQSAAEHESEPDVVDEIVAAQAVVAESKPV